MFDKLIGSLQLPAEVLKLRSKRQEVIAANIGNADTPNYKAVDFKFGDALQAVMPQAASKDNIQTGTQVGTNSASRAPMLAAAQEAGGLLRTHVQHFDLDGKHSTISPFLQYRKVQNGALDNNSVDMDRERAAFAENTVKYEAALRVLNGRVSTLKQAMGSGNQ